MLCRSSFVVRHSLPRLPFVSNALAESIAKSCFSSKSQPIGPFDSRSLVTTMGYWMSSAVHAPISKTDILRIHDKDVNESYDTFIQDCIKKDPLFNWRFEKKSNEFEDFWNGLSFESQLAWIYTNEQDEDNVLGRTIRGLAIKRLEDIGSYSNALQAFKEAKVHIEEKKKTGALSDTDKHLEQIILKEIDEIKSYRK